MANHVVFRLLKIFSYATSGYVPTGDKREKNPFVASSDGWVIASNGFFFSLGDDREISQKIFPLKS